MEGIRRNGNNNTQATGCIDKHVFTFLQYVMFQFEADSSNFFYCTQFVLPSALIAALEHLLCQSHLRFWKYTFFWQGKQNPFLFVECWWMTMALLFCQMQSNEATNQCSENNEAVWVHVGKEWFTVHCAVYSTYIAQQYNRQWHNFLGCCWMLVQMIMIYSQLQNSTHCFNLLQGGELMSKMRQASR